MKLKSFASGVVLASLISTAAPVFAHHSFEAEFDRAKQVTLTGTVTKVEWMNPHSSRRPGRYRARLSRKGWQFQDQCRFGVLTGWPCPQRSIQRRTGLQRSVRLRDPINGPQAMPAAVFVFGEKRVCAGV